LATLLIVALLQAFYIYHNNFYFIYQNNNFKYFISQLLLASNWGFLDGFSFNGPIWSISVEVLVYCGFFLVLRAFGKKVYLNIGIILMCMAAKYLKIENLTIDCLAFFYAGGLSAIVLERAEKWKLKYLISTSALLYILIAPAVVYILKLYLINHFPQIFLMAYTPALLYIFSRQIAMPSWIQKWVEVCGNMTYSSYLLHFPIQLTIVNFCNFNNIKIPLYSNQFFIFFILLTLLGSLIIYRYFEMPMQNIIRNRYL
jgi:peptidoglycan/LPS O-acetylase OafA/YrhL